MHVRNIAVKLPVSVKIERAILDVISTHQTVIILSVTGTMTDVLIIAEAMVIPVSHTFVSLIYGKQDIFVKNR